jgi:hypothetical protein
LSAGLALSLMAGHLACGRSAIGGATADATQEGFIDAGCSAADPCVPGTSGCPGNGLPVPREGDSCSMPGLACYGYGTFSCTETLTCSVDHTWQIGCPLHPFGLDSGSCGCAHPD